MTDITDHVAGRVRGLWSGAARCGHRIEEAFWGYRIVPTGAPPLHLIVMQSVAMISGATFFAAAAALLVMTGPNDLVFRLPVTLVITALGLALMWFASRGAMVRIEIDTINGEVRETVCNRTGAVSILGRYGFDCIGGVFLVRPDEAGATLVLRYRNTARTLTVARGSDAELSRLRDRLGRDLIIARDGS